MKRPSGAELIAAERQRQIADEGWTASHDDNHHDEGELAIAAACYALPHDERMRTIWEERLVTLLWPWDWCRWKPAPKKTIKHRIRELTKAGALIAAEIDRLQRAQHA